MFWWCFGVWFPKIVADGRSCNRVDTRSQRSWTQCCRGGPNTDRTRTEHGPNTDPNTNRTRTEHGPNTDPNTDLVEFGGKSLFSDSFVTFWPFCVLFLLFLISCLLAEFTQLVKGSGRGVLGPTDWILFVLVSRLSELCLINSGFICE